MKNKKIKNATPLEYDGIKFKSKLEVTAYKTFKEHNFKILYEPATFTLWEGFKARQPYYAPGKSRELSADCTKIIDIKYTPDFIIYYNKTFIVVEVKGKENDTYYLKNKLFRGYIEEKLLSKGKTVIYFEVRSKKQILQAIEIIKVMTSKPVLRIQKLISSLPERDINLGYKFVQNREFESLKELVDSAIIKVRKGLKKENPREEYLKVDLDLLNDLKVEVDEYCASLGIYDLDDDYSDDLNELELNEY